MGKGQQQRAAAAAAAAAEAPGSMFPALGAQPDDFPALGTQPASTPAWGKGGQPAAPTTQAPAGVPRAPPPGAAASSASEGPLYIVMGSKKGGFPVSIEPRAKGKKVTVVHNVSGDLDQLCKDLKGAVGSGGVVRDGNVEVQGEHVARTEAFLMKKGCIKGVSGANKAAAQPVSKEEAKPPQKSIARLDQKAQQLKQKQ